MKIAGNSYQTGIVSTLPAQHPPPVTHWNAVGPRLQADPKTSGGDSHTNTVREPSGNRSATIQGSAGNRLKIIWRPSANRPVTVPKPFRDHAAIAATIAAPSPVSQKGPMSSEVGTSLEN